MCSHLGQQHRIHSYTKCWKIGPKGCKLAWMVSFFSALGPIQGHKVQHSLITWGRLKILFFFLNFWKNIYHFFSIFKLLNKFKNSKFFWLWGLNCRLLRQSKHIRPSLKHKHKKNVFIIIFITIICQIFQNFKKPSAKVKVLNLINYLRVYCRLQWGGVLQYWFLSLLLI